MKYHFYLFLMAMLSLAAPGWAQVPTVSVPANNATGVAVSGASITVFSNSTDHANTGDEVIYVEISNQNDFNGSYYWASPVDVTRTSDAPASYNFMGPVSPNALSPGTVYYIRAYSEVWGEGPLNTFTTAGATVTETNRVSLVNSLPTNPAAGALDCIPNARYLTFSLSQALTNATSYVIQFDTTNSTFTHVIDSIIVTAGTTRRIRIDLGGIAGVKLSGQTVFMRSHGRNSTSNGPFGIVRRMVWPLQPCKLAAPTGSVDRYAFKLWTNAVNRGTKYYFQVDDDPTFSSPHVLQGTFASLNRTVTGITGNVFENNYTAGGTGRAFNYISQLTNSTYYVRVRGWNSQQNGYWADTLSITPLPILRSGFDNLVNNQTNVPVSFRFIMRDDPSFVEANYALQVSKNADFSSPIINQASLPTRTYFVPNLEYGTTYYARTRITSVSNATSAWANVQFTTQPLPTPFVTYPTNGTVWSNIAVHAYASVEGSITQYDWEVERLTAPGATFSGSSSFYGRNFSAFLQRGKSYRMRVRGYAGGQNLTGNWSAWVSFSVSGAGAMPVADAQPEAQATSLTLATTGEPAAYPNPFTESLNLQLPEGALTYTVTDLSGRVIEAVTPACLLQDIGAGWPRGTYLVSVAMAEGVSKRLRLIKQ